MINEENKFLPSPHTLKNKADKCGVYLAVMLLMLTGREPTLYARVGRSVGVTSSWLINVETRSKLYSENLMSVDGVPEVMEQLLPEDTSPNKHVLKFPVKRFYVDKNVMYTYFLISVCDLFFFKQRMSLILLRTTRQT